jgi:hypothetical protein
MGTSLYPFEQAFADDRRSLIASPRPIADDKALYKPTQ